MNKAKQLAIGFAFFFGSYLVARILDDRFGIVTRIRQTINF